MRYPELTLDYEDAFVPAVPPPGGAPARTAPTTHVLVRVPAWHGNVFCMWAPENVGLLWRNWDADRALIASLLSCRARRRRPV